MSDLLQDLPVQALIITLGVFLCVLLSGFALTGWLAGRNPIKQRLAGVVARTAPQHRNAVDAVDLVLSGRQRPGFLERFVPNPQSLKVKLARTGRDIGIGRYLFVTAMLCAAIALLLSYLTGLGLVVAAPVGFFLGLLVSHLGLAVMVKRRQARFLSQFPEAIDLIVRGLKSGLPVPESIRTISLEMPDPVGPEFRRVIEQIGVGTALDDALWLAADRIDLSDFRFFVIALSVQRETGGNLAETLENLSDILRQRRTTKLKIRALSSEARASALIIGALPFIMYMLIEIVRDDYLDPLFIDPRGILMVCIGLAWLGVGFAVMAKMVRFEI